MNDLQIVDENSADEPKKQAATVKHEHSRRISRVDLVSHLHQLWKKRDCGEGSGD